MLNCLLRLHKCSIDRQRYSHLVTIVGLPIHSERYRVNKLLLWPLPWRRGRETSELLKAALSDAGRGKGKLTCLYCPLCLLFFSQNQTLDGWCQCANIDEDTVC